MNEELPQHGEVGRLKKKTPDPCEEGEALGSSITNDLFQYSFSWGLRFLSTLEKVIDSLSFITHAGFSYFL